MIRKILILFGFLVIGISLGGLLLPSDWKVERSVVIDATAARIYPLVASLQDGWPLWSVFDFEDPTITYTQSGPKIGQGATRTWTSKKMGDGTQKITKASEAEGVEFELAMHPDRFKLIGAIKFEVIQADPKNPKTKVTWIDTGRAGFNPFYRIMIQFMDNMMGPMFEQSLERLKNLSEKKAN